MSKLPMRVQTVVSHPVATVAIGNNPPIQNMPQNQNCQLATSRPISRKAVRVNLNRTKKLVPAPTTTVKTGVKRPISSSSSTSSSQQDGGQPKPKISKKIPEWDFKTKFQVLNDKHKQLVESENAMKIKVEDLEKILNNKITELEAVNEKLATQTAEVLNIKEKNNTLEQQNSEIKSELERMQIVLNTEREEYKQHLNKITTELNELNELANSQKVQLQHLYSERKILNNTVQDLKGNIRVFCRVRPPKQNEQSSEQCAINYMDESSFEIEKTSKAINQITGKCVESKHEFTFDRVFNEQTTQSEMFEELSQLVQSALDGYNVCVFAYGQTGSGKTYTMLGGDNLNEIGIIPRTVELIFKQISILAECGWRYNVKVSFMEIYNETLRDLLNPNEKLQKLDIFYNDGKGTTVPNLTFKNFNSAEELSKCMTLANHNRATAATDFNEHSSRSHAIVKICLEGALEEKKLIYNGCINLIDLAGSECAKNSNDRSRLMEAKYINKSLSNLGDVISALKSKSKHIPYRNSKLTFLLQSSLAFNSKTLMIVNINRFEECFNETLSSLRFATKVREVKTTSKRNRGTAI